MRQPFYILSLLVSLVNNRVEASLNVFDVHDVSATTEFINIAVAEPNAHRRRSSMPGDISATFECRGKLMRLQLKHYPDIKTSDSIPGGIARERFQYLIGDGIPIYTRQKGLVNNETRIALDTFPRLFAQSCRTYKDPVHQASLVGIRDPQFQSIKFFGSFFMDGIHFFLQPFSLSKANDNTDGIDKRLHVIEEVPELDFSSDSSTVVKSGGRAGMAKGIINSARNPRVSGSNSASTNRQLRRGRPSKRKTNIFTEGVDKVRQGRKRKNRNRFQDFFTKFNSQRQQLGSVLGEPEGKLREFHSSNIPNRGSDGDYTVEVFIVCDYLCYQRFQGLYNVSDVVMTKNAIAEFFAYVRTFYQTAYGNVALANPGLGISIEIRVVGLYIATEASDKIIGDYVIGDNNQIDAKPSAFEFALWVEDSLKVSLKADHYALVTGYDLSGSSSSVLGLVTNIPSVCDVDRVSLNELLMPKVAVVMAHELGHSLGSQHDGLTSGFCRDEQQFIMAAFIGGNVPFENTGNPFRFSKCSAQFFQAALQDKTCLKRDDFNGSPLPREPPLIGQQFSLDQQCDALFSGSQTCREQVTLSPGSWSQICRNAQCVLRASEGLCFPLIPLEFTSCGNRKWCRRGVCVESTAAPEKPIDCPAGDNAKVSCDVNFCTRTYDDVMRFIECCDTCRPIKTERFVIVPPQYA